ncbi:heat shock protein beta-1-like [Thalassophryne amazonica]|uniref:heat shock protein beta-1-like n=1 Tax=Thalassophryne amazonica TaxID=390379 RepID=UPI001471DF48|nr:heat shock protein beta-1-like [Thalassophryne amazonica]
MGERNKVLARPIFRRDVSWDPFPNWTQPSRIFTQDVGLPPFLDSTDLDWLDWAKRRLVSFSWPRCTETPILPLFSQKDQRQVSRAVSEVMTGQNSWKISLDVSHFSPEEITVTTQEGYLQISGTHEERQDAHGLVSRCFTRKYKLPHGVDLQHIGSSLSGDGVLSVEAPVPGTTTGDSTGEMVIPIQIRQKKEDGK